MNLNYSQSQHQLTDDDGNVVAPPDACFAGNHEGLNNPAMQNVGFIGPLPQGVYSVGDWGEHGALGPNSAPLTQVSGDTYGRNNFFCHGPGGHDPSQCSEGCIVVEAEYRQKVIDLAPDTITVVG